MEKFKIESYLITRTNVFGSYGNKQYDECIIRNVNREFEEMFRHTNIIFVLTSIKLIKSFIPRSSSVKYNNIVREETVINRNIFNNLTLCREKYNLLFNFILA